MKIKQNESTDTSGVINISSLLDIMFILIIFFLVTMSFKEEEHDIRINLPETDTTLSSAARAVIINVRKDGSYYIGSRRITLDKLTSELSGLLKINPGQKVLIRGDRHALHGQVAAAIAVCKKSGIRDANIGYMTSNN